MQSEKEAEELVLASKALTEAGIDVIFHESDPLNRGYFNAIEQPRDAAVQPVKLAQAIFKASGADIITGNEVYKIEQSNLDEKLSATQKSVYEEVMAPYR